MSGRGAGSRRSTVGDGAALSPALWSALIGFAFGGTAHGVKNVLLRTLIHERVPARRPGASSPSEWPYSLSIAAG